MAQKALLAKTGTDHVRPLDSASREIANIERVAALLRERHPELEMWHPDLDPPTKKRPSPAWVAIGVVWVTTLILIGLAAAGVTFLLS